MRTVIDEVAGMRVALDQIVKLLAETNARLGAIEGKLDEMANDVDSVNDHLATIRQRSS